MAEFLRIVVCDLDSERRLVPKCVSGKGWNFSTAPAGLSMGKPGGEALLYCNCI